MGQEMLVCGATLICIIGGITRVGFCLLESGPALIPREVLFGNPVKASPEISPDGKRLAYLAPVGNVLNVWVKTIGLEDDAPVTQDRERGIRRYFWAEDNIHILYLQDAGGNENWRLYGVNLETRQIKDLTPFDNVQVRIVEHNRQFPNELLIAMNKEDEKLHDVYHLDLTTAQLKLVAKNPGTVTDWVVDSRFRVRAAVASLPDGGTDLLLRESEDSEWKKFVSWDFEDSSSSGPVSFSKDGKSIYLIDSRGSNTNRLVEADISTSTVRVIASDARFDIGTIMIHPDTYRLQAVSFLKARTEWVVLDGSIKDDFSRISKITRGDYFVSSRNRADDTWVVGFSKDNGPVSYYIYRRKARAAEFLFDHKPDLNKYTLAIMEPFSFVARDGLRIQGYLTYPPGKKKKDLPVVLNVHGGPWVRDSWGYDPEAQWLANRGYVCLQVNYRGSSGYGKKFLNAGNKEWAGKMHNDLVDAVHWLIKKGVADPKKIAIYGGSYGGYAALVGATFTPDFFRCAIDLVGPSNLITFIRSVPPYWSNYLADLHKRVGNPDTEFEFLKSRSPLFKVDAIKIPLLIAQGANDPRVKQAESEQIIEALKKKNLEYEYLLFPDEGHGFAKPGNRLKFYAAAEKFLAKYLHGLYEE
jgi:dipeptidyl aminopeptidase/acylaminoacyl peptidase